MSFFYNKVEFVFFSKNEFPRFESKESKSTSGVEKKDTFPFSGESVLLENYKCFDDQSALEPLSGEEILENSNEWDDDQKRRWYFFYRPYNYGYNIAGNQKKNIIKMKIAIEKKINQAKFFKVLIAILTGTIAFLVVGTDVNIFLLLSGLITILFLSYLHGLIENEVPQLKLNIIELESEVAYLVEKQQKILADVISASELEKLFWRDMKDLENKFIEDFLNKNSDRVGRDASKYYSDSLVSEFFRKNNIDAPIFPLIPSWGLLQESQSINGDYVKRAGLYALSEKINEKIATWRKTSDGKVFFRVWYIQFLFFQDKALYTVSIYYDFISKRKYGIRQEKYLYNHIAHCSYNQENLSYMIDSPMLRALNIPSELTSNIYGNETKTISFSCSSGSTYRCVLPDQDISNGLNKWIEYKRSVYEKENNLNALDEEALREMLINNIRNDEMIITLANQSFREISNNIEKFSIKEDVFRK